jgi:hypothetical protein
VQAKRHKTLLRPPPEPLLKPDSSPV